MGIKYSVVARDDRRSPGSALMSSAAFLAIFSAVAIAIASAAFGVGIARVFWADDLSRAKRIDEIRSRTETSLRDKIAAKEGIIRILQERIEHTPGCRSPDQR